MTASKTKTARKRAVASVPREAAVRSAEAKHGHIARMLQELRAGAEQLSANADRLLSRIS